MELETANIPGQTDSKEALLSKYRHIFSQYIENPDFGKDGFLEKIIRDVPCQLQIRQHTQNKSTTPHMEHNPLTPEQEDLMFEYYNGTKQYIHSVDLGKKYASTETINTLVKNMIESQGILVMANMGLIYSATLRLKLYDNDDAIFEATKHLNRLIDKFDFTRGWKFSTYAYHSLINKLVDYKDQSIRRSKALGDYYLGCLRKDREIINNERKVNDQHLSVFEKIELSEILNPTELSIIQYRYLDCLDGKEQPTQKQLVPILKMSRPQITRIERKALDKIREAIERNEADALYWR